MNIDSCRIDHADSSSLASHLQHRASLVLPGLGILAVLAHATLRFPLHLPGHHGLEWMALLVVARRITSYRWAATMVAFAAAVASSLPVMGFHDSLTPLIYLTPGVMLDLGWRALPLAWRQSTLALACAAAISFAAVPVVHWLGGALIGLPYGSLANGVGFVLGMHLVFGSIGGGMGALVSGGLSRAGWHR